MRHRLVTAGLALGLLVGAGCLPLRNPMQRRIPPLPDPAFAPDQDDTGHDFVHYPDDDLYYCSIHDHAWVEEGDLWVLRPIGQVRGREGAVIVDPDTRSPIPENRPDAAVEAAEEEPDRSDLTK